MALAHPEALLVRTSLLYGGPTPSKHELAAHDPGFTFYTNEIRSPVHVTDLAQALLELAELDTAGPLHVAGADDVSRAEFAELITGRPGQLASRRRTTRPLDCSLDSSRARNAATHGAPRRSCRPRLVVLEPLGDRLGMLRRALHERIDLRGGTRKRSLHGPAHARLDPRREPVAEVLRAAPAAVAAVAPAPAARRSRARAGAWRPRSRARRRAPARRSPSAAARRAGRSTHLPAACAPTSARVVSESRT